MPDPVLILFLASNPAHTTRVRLDREVRSIRAIRREASHRDRFEIDSEWAVEYGDLQRILSARRPGVVHFGGHGGWEAGVLLERGPGRTRVLTWDEEGTSETPHPTGATALGRSARSVVELFAILDEVGERVPCVVLNACYSERQARALARHVGCVVGMSAAIDDGHAISFSEGFYRELFNGRAIDAAFRFGCQRIEAVHGAPGDVPRLLPGLARPEEIVLRSEPQLNFGPRIERGVEALVDRRFAESREIFSELVGHADAPAEVHCYLALALVGGRSFNQLHPAERAEIEGRIVRAARGAPGWDLPLSLLRALEIDFYELHGVASGHRAELPTQPPTLSDRSLCLLSSVRLSRGARRRLGVWKPNVVKSN